TNSSPGPPSEPWAACRAPGPTRAGAAAWRRRSPPSRAAPTTCASPSTATMSFPSPSEARPSSARPRAPTAWSSSPRATRGTPRALGSRCCCTELFGDGFVLEQLAEELADLLARSRERLPPARGGPVDAARPPAGLDRRLEVPLLLE